MITEQDPFGILEEKIGSLMAAYDSLKKEKVSLEEQISERTAAIKSLEEKIARMNQERERAKEKVENLLGRLDRLIVSTR
jgi:chromosome segregation ATPase